jgi:hypothetical protein
MPARPAAAAQPGAAPAQPAAASEAKSTTLWDLLTEDERAFFTQQAALGSATYRPGRAAAAPQTTGAPTGQRIDVRA